MLHDLDRSPDALSSNFANQKKHAWNDLPGVSRFEKWN
jgi:hypothetical protein